jgi:hypothetical protein
MSKYTKKRHVRRTRKHGRRKSQKGSGNTATKSSKIGPEWLDLREHVLPRENSTKVLPEGAQISPHKPGRRNKVSDSRIALNAAKTLDIKYHQPKPPKRTGYH